MKEAKYTTKGASITAFAHVHHSPEAHASAIAGKITIKEAPADER
jgi:hypothetical protein